MAITDDIDKFISKNCPGCKYKCDEDEHIMNFLLTNLGKCLRYKSHEIVLNKEML